MLKLMYKKIITFLCLKMCFSGPMQECIKSDLPVWLNPDRLHQTQQSFALSGGYLMFEMEETSVLHQTI